MSECLLFAETPPPAPATLRRLADLPTAALSDSMRRFSGAPGLLPVCGQFTGGRLVGPALTVRTAPGDNLVVHKAADLAKPGDVLVVDAGGHVDRAIVGELLCLYAKSRGVAGIVIDGAVRDVRELNTLGLPVFARGVSHLGPYKNGPGELRGTINLGGAAVSQGDLIVGDEDGIVVLPRWDCDAVIVSAEALVEREAEAATAIASGRWDRSWLDSALDIRMIGNGIGEHS